MTKGTAMAAALTRFRRETRGGVAIIFALSAIPFFMAAGMAVDFSLALRTHTRMQAALDAGALAAAASTTLTDAQRKQLAVKTFENNFYHKNKEGLVAVPKVNIVGEQISMSASLEYPTAFMRIAGFNSMDIGASVNVNIPQQLKAEIALVLDYSGSMTEVSGGKVKYVAMRDAAIKLVNDLTLDGKSDKVKFGLVPFSHQVYAKLPSEYVVGQKKGSVWSGCTVDRQAPFNTSDTTPDENNDASKWGQKQAPDHMAWGCGAYLPNNLVVRPISANHKGVVDQLKVMKTYMWTNIALGFEFGWHLLSPNAPFGGVASYGDEETMKILVLLTDGRQTEPAFGKNGKQSVANGEKNLETMCGKAKGKGIRVMTVAFDLEKDDPSGSTTKRLRNCSTDPDEDFFIAESDAELARAFEQIKTHLASAIYVSK